MSKILISLKSNIENCSKDSISSWTDILWTDWRGDWSDVTWRDWHEGNSNHECLGSSIDLKGLLGEIYFNPDEIAILNELGVIM